ncbi:hypothetical protein RUND412_005758, partial [Rhizina undulata]
MKSQSYRPNYKRPFFWPRSEYYKTPLLEFLEFNEVQPFERKRANDFYRSRLLHHFLDTDVQHPRQVIMDYYSKLKDYKETSRAAEAQYFKRFRAARRGSSEEAYLESRDRGARQSRFAPSPELIPQRELPQARIEEDFNSAAKERGSRTSIPRSSSLQVCPSQNSCSPKRRASLASSLMFETPPVKKSNTNDSGKINSTSNKPILKIDCDKASTLMLDETGGIATPVVSGNSSSICNEARAEIKVRGKLYEEVPPLNWQKFPEGGNSASNSPIGGKVITVLLESPVTVLQIRDLDLGQKNLEKMRTQLAQSDAPEKTFVNRSTQTDMHAKLLETAFLDLFGDIACSGDFNASPFDSSVSYPSEHMVLGGNWERNHDAKGKK